MSTQNTCLCSSKDKGISFTLNFLALYLFQDTHGDDLLSAAFNGVLECVNLKPDELGDICIGKQLVSRGCNSSRCAANFLFDLIL